MHNQHNLSKKEPEMRSPPPLFREIDFEYGVARIHQQRGNIRIRVSRSSGHTDMNSVYKYFSRLDIETHSQWL